MQTMKLFIKKLKTDEDLLKRMAELKKADNREGMIALMKESGVTDEDIKKGIELEKRFTTKCNDELNDDELEMVAGGKGCVADFKSDDGTRFCLLYHVNNEGNIGCSLGHGYKPEPEQKKTVDPGYFCRMDSSRY